MRGLLIILMLSALNAGAQETYSFERIMTEIEQNLPELQRYQKLIDASSERARASRAWMPPRVTAGLDRFPYNPSMLNEEGPMNLAGVMVGIEQMFPNQSRRKLETEIAESSGKEFESLRNETMRAYRRQASLAFLGSLYARRKQDVIMESIRVLKILRETTMEKVASGTSGPADVYKAEARIADAENMLLMAETEENAFKAALNSFLLRAPESELFTDTASYSDPSILIMDTVSLLTRPDFAAMQERIRRMNLQAEYMNVGRRPEFGIEFQHMQMFAMGPMYSLMGMITIPFAPWASDMYKGETRAMQLEAEAMNQELEGMERMARGMYAEKIIMAEGLQKQMMKLSHSAIPALKKALDADIQDYAQNNGNFNIVLDTWEMLLMKELELITLENSYRETLVEVEYENYRP